MIKTRFAPSPTGYLHIGSLRTALYAYLFARQKKGKLILRIEDTDQNRFVEGAVESLIRTLQWAGITYDEGPEVGGSNSPYIQSERLELYKKEVQVLLDKGQAYRCFCSMERLDEMRKEQQERKQAPMYDKKCRKRSHEEIHQLLEQNSPHVIRMAIPENEILRFRDVVRGDLEFASNTIDDQVLMKSDGFPTYHLANVVDDHDMGITHVIRAEEWLPSTPKHIYLYKAFEWKMPEFAHIPLILNPDKSKLSKRQGDVAVEDYRAKGYLPEAMINFIVLLGWNPGGGETNEIFSMEELIAQFDLEKVHKSGAVFDLNRLKWINGEYLRKLSPEAFIEKYTTYLEDYATGEEKKDRKNQLKDINIHVIQALQARIKTWEEAGPMLDYLVNFNPNWTTLLPLMENEKNLRKERFKSHRGRFNPSHRFFFRRKH